MPNVLRWFQAIFYPLHISLHARGEDASILINIICFQFIYGCPSICPSILYKFCKSTKESIILIFFALQFFVSHLPNNQIMSVCSLMLKMQKSIPTSHQRSEKYDFQLFLIKIFQKLFICLFFDVIAALLLDVSGFSDFKFYFL